MDIPDERSRPGCSVTVVVSLKEGQWHDPCGLRAAAPVKRLQAAMPERPPQKAERRTQPYRLIVNRPVLWPLASLLAPDQC